MGARGRTYNPGVPIIRGLGDSDGVKKFGQDLRIDIKKNRRVERSATQVLNSRKPRSPPEAFLLLLNRFPQKYPQARKSQGRTIGECVSLESRV
jgi:hypothetical protein